MKFSEKMRSDLAATLHDCVARMWKFEPEKVIVIVGSTIDIYVSTADVTHGLTLLGSYLNTAATSANL